MKTFGKIGMVLLFCLILLVPVSNSSLGEYSEPTVGLAAMATIVTDRCPVRETQDPHSKILFEGEAGQVYEIIAENGQMVCVLLGEESMGYLAQEDILLSVASVAQILPQLVHSGFADRKSETLSDTDSHDSPSEEAMDPAGVTILSDTGANQETVNYDAEIETDIETDYSVEPLVATETSAPVQTVEKLEEPKAEEASQESLLSEQNTLEPTDYDSEQTELASIIQEETETPDESIEAVTAQLSADEETMCSRINQLRTTKGLAPLMPDAKLVDIARIKTEELIVLDYFSHTSPVYGSPQDMLSHFNVTYYYMGENLGMNLSVEAAYQAFIDSPLHLDNILNPEFTHIGIGIQNKDSKQLIITLLFIDATK
jgi:uncharacterized protein YkwD